MPTNVQLDTDQRTSVTRERDSEDRWDRDDTSTQWTVNHLEIVDGVRYRDVVTELDLELGEEVFVVYAVYSTGDSFGTDDQAELELISVHRDEKVALENEERLFNAKERQDNDWSTAWNTTLLRDDGSTFEYRVPWFGYFESLDYVRTQKVQVR